MTRFQQTNKTLSPKLKLLFFGIILLGLLAFNLNNTYAQSKSFAWDQYDVVITLQPNGELLVEETQTLNFVGEPFTFGYATIPVGAKGNNDGIRNLSVREGDFIYTEDRSNAPGTFYTTNYGGDEVTINWYFEPALGRRTYTFSYIVDGAVIVGTSNQGDGDQIFWNAIPADHPATINNSTVTIILPEGVSPQQYTGTTDYLVSGYVDGDAATVATQVNENGRIITYQLTQPLPPEQAFEVRVQFPHGILDIPVPAWQSNMQRQDTFNLFGYALSLLCLIFGPLLILFLWYTQGRDPETGTIVPEYITHPPDNLRPAVVGTLTDERADMRDIVSIIVDLAHRGYLTIAEAEEKDHTLELTDKDRGHLRPYETKLISSAFHTETSITLDSLTNKFYHTLPTLRTQLYDELVQEKLVHRSPHSIRRSYKFLGWFLFSLAGIMFFCSGSIIDPDMYTAYGFCPAIAIAVTAVTLFLTGRHMPRKTEKGTIAAQKWLAFKTYLQNIDQYEDLSQTTDIFEQYLPYATAFGLDRSWIYKFSKQLATPIPTWYVPMRPHHTSNSKSSSNNSPTQSMPSLDSMSDGMAGSLESMSSNLTRMLNSTASTLSSRPQSSSSSSGSSGSFSSGFSGGSSFSSSGGGSRGFG